MKPILNSKHTIAGDSMIDNKNDNKQVQTIIRTTQEEKDLITNEANNKGLSINEYIKKTLLNAINSDDSTSDEVDNNNDSKLAIIQILQEQLSQKDNQINQLHQLLYQGQQKLLEAPKKWYQFWKS